MEGKIHVNPVFQNDKILFIKRKDFKEVIEKTTKYYKGLQAKITDIRPLACHSNKDLLSVIGYIDEFVNLERIKRNWTESTMK